MDKEKQIIEIKECIDAVYGADCAYYDVDGFAIANEIYNTNYRKQEWISVDERLPEKDGMYLIFSPYTNKEGGIIYCNRFLTKGNPIFPPNSFESISKVTHWMPLPEPPETKGETE